MAIISDINAGDDQPQQSQSPVDQPKPEEEPTKEEEQPPEPERLAPNEANGLDMENYTWGQSLQEVNITVPVPLGTKARFVVCEIKKNHIKVGLKNSPPILDGEFFSSVKTDECYWSLEGSDLSILLTKQDRLNWWMSLIKGGPEIDMQKFKPEPSKFSELDVETRSRVEKMMFDQQQLTMGLPTSDEIKNQSQSPVDQPKPEEEPTKEEEQPLEPERLAPNNANGLDMENYTWGQSLQEVNITVPVPPGTKARFVVCEIKKNHIKVGLKNSPPILEGEFFFSVKTDDCFWCLEGSDLSILLTKQDRFNWWKSLIKGGPEIDIQKFKPEPSKFSELDIETRSRVEKKMFDQQQLTMGLPTSDEIQNQELMKKFKEQFPNMDGGAGSR